ncbi:MAG: hypothetical protein LC437_01270 [Thiohalomonas sp.]|nr:hypothetical protein [Thiohalomonas sp.]
MFAFIAMFLGAVSGVAGTFYLLVEAGDIESNLTIAIATLTALWLLVVILRHYNKKRLNVIKNSSWKALKRKLR